MRGKYNIKDPMTKIQTGAKTKMCRVFTGHTYLLYYYTVMHTVILCHSFVIYNLLNMLRLGDLADNNRFF